MTTTEATRSAREALAGIAQALATAAALAETATSVEPSWPDGPSLDPDSRQEQALARAAQSPIQHGALGYEAEVLRAWVAQCDLAVACDRTALNAATEDLATADAALDVLEAAHDDLMAALQDRLDGTTATHTADADLADAAHSALAAVEEAMVVPEPEPDEDADEG